MLMEVLVGFLLLSLFFQSTSLFWSFTEGGNCTRQRYKGSQWRPCTQTPTMIPLWWSRPRVLKADPHLQSSCVSPKNFGSILSAEISPVSCQTGFRVPVSSHQPLYTSQILLPWAHVCSGRPRCKKKNKKHWRRQRHQILKQLWGWTIFMQDNKFVCGSNDRLSSQIRTVTPQRDESSMVNTEVFFLISFFLFETQTFFLACLIQAFCSPCLISRRAFPFEGVEPYVPPHSKPPALCSAAL